MPVGPSCSTRPLLAVPRNHGNETAAGGGYRAHLRAVTANNGPLIVAQSNPRNLRPGRAWDQRTLTFSVTLRCTCMSRHFNAACMTAPRCMFLPGPSHPSCWWKACPDTTKRAHPQASQTNILPSQITASASLTSSAESVMGQLSIGRFAELYGYSVYAPTTGIKTRRATSGRNARFAEHLEIFTHVQCGALPPQQCAVPIPPPAHRLRHLQFTLMQPMSAGAASVSSVQWPAQPIGAIRSSAWRCDQCDSSVLPSTSSSCSSMPSMSSLSRGPFAATTAVVECTTTDSAPPRTAPCQHWQHQWNNAQHAP
ncbi:hypothetical protein TcG_13142 [Trypanosoma cruzi]|nr:hypothetical protein TcG_13142 [Trypanosoma cruzi]